MWPPPPHLPRRLRWWTPRTPQALRRLRRRRPSGGSRGGGVGAAGGGGCASCVAQVLWAAEGPVCGAAGPGASRLRRAGHNRRTKPSCARSKARPCMGARCGKEAESARAAGNSCPGKSSSASRVGVRFFFRRGGTPPCPLLPPQPAAIRHIRGAQPDNPRIFLPRLHLASCGCRRRHLRRAGAVGADREFRSGRLCGPAAAVREARAVDARAEPRGGARCCFWTRILLHAVTRRSVRPSAQPLVWMRRVVIVS